MSVVFINPKMVASFISLKGTYFLVCVLYVPSTNNEHLRLIYDQSWLLGPMKAKESRFSRGWWDSFQMEGTSAFPIVHGTL